MKTYSRRDLIGVLIQKFKLKRETAHEIVEELLVQIATQLIAGRKVELRGFGVFKPGLRKKKIGRNPRKPQAGDYILPERRQVKFYVGKHLDAALNQEEICAQPLP